MSRSCCSTSLNKKRVTCTVCGQTCLLVNRQTMLHQVQFPENQSISEGDYAFCANLDCHVAYFSGDIMIQKETLRVFQADEPAMLCYCFDVSRSTYRKALQSHTSETIKAFVVKQTKAKVCACESRNPSGRCCLTDFKRMEDEYDA